MLTQLKTLGLPIYYHSVDNSTIELDFLVQLANRVVPIEVKAETNVKAKSMRLFIEKYPELTGVRISMLPYQQQQWLVNIPLYACSLLSKIDY